MVRCLHAAPNICACVLYVLIMSTWVSSGFSGLLRPSKTLACPRCERAVCMMPYNRLVSYSGWIPTLCPVFLEQFHHNPDLDTVIIKDQSMNEWSSCRNQKQVIAETHSSLRFMFLADSSRTVSCYSSIYCALRCFSAHYGCKEW